MLNIENTDGQHALDQTQLQAVANGYAVRSGCAVSLPPNASSIETDVAAGEVYLAGLPVRVKSETLTHPDGDPDDPRWDAVCATGIAADGTADLEVVPGTPAPVAVRDDGTQLPLGRKMWRPSSSNGIDEAEVCLALLPIPAGATSNDDVDAAVGHDPPVVDRRVRWRAPRSGWIRLGGVEDGDETTRIDWSIDLSGARAGFRALRLVASVGEQSASSNRLQLRINANTNSVYSQHSLSSDGITTSTDETELELGSIPANSLGSGTLHIRGTPLQTTTNSRVGVNGPFYPGASGTSAGLLVGGLDASETATDSLRLFSSGAMTGTATLHGMVTG